jgi:hypothetical protein
LIIIEYKARSPSLAKTGGGRWTTGKQEMGRKGKGTQWWDKRENIIFKFSSIIIHYRTVARKVVSFNSRTLNKINGKTLHSS